MWTLNINKNDPQSDQKSFMGGVPRLPNGTIIPQCKLCGEQQTFMFQIAFPQDTDWHKKTVACFACTKCVDENYLIPEMLNGQIQDADIPSGFLTSYQRNFSFLVFDTESAQPVENFEQRVEFAAIDTTAGSTVGDFGKLGGDPNWLLDDESPSTYDSTQKMSFLFQVAPNVEFRRMNGAPPQVELDLMGSPSPSPLEYYQLFLGNALYGFGTPAGDPLVYAITQV